MTSPFVYAAAVIEVRHTVLIHADKKARENPTEKPKKNIDKQIKVKKTIVKLKTGAGIKKINQYKKIWMIHLQHPYLQGVI